VAGVSERESTELAEVLLALSLELQAGVLPEAAMQATCSTTEQPQLRRAAELVRQGLDPAPALAGSEVAVVRALGLLWELARVEGAPLAEAVAALARSCRGCAQSQRALRAAMAGPRASARLLAGLPLVGIALGEGIGARPVHVLLSTGPGRVCLLVGVLFTAAGSWWTRALVRRVGLR
jgi:tight adherence protein B